MSNASCQSILVNKISAETSTAVIATDEQSTSTSINADRHTQTIVVKVKEKATGASEEMAYYPTPPSSISIALQVDTDLTSPLPIQGVSGSEVWVESVASYLQRNAVMIRDMSENLQSLKLMCDDVT